MLGRDKVFKTIIQGKCPYESGVDNLEEDLEKARVNRVELYYMYRLLHACRHVAENPVYKRRLALLEEEYRVWREEAARILNSLNRIRVRYVVIKHAPYPHLSYDLDIVFLAREDYESSIDVITSSSILRIDPHAGGVREFKALTIVVPAKYMWAHRVKRRVLGVEAYTVSNELSAIIYALHAFKHREIYLGDLLSYMFFRGNSCIKNFSTRLMELNAVLPVVFIEKIIGETILGKTLSRTDTFLDNIIILQVARMLSRHEEFPLVIPRDLSSLIAFLRMPIPYRQVSRLDKSFIPQKLGDSF